MLYSFSFLNSSFWDICLTVVPDLVISISASVILGLDVYLTKKTEGKQNLDNIKEVQNVSIDSITTNYGIINQILCMICIVTLCCCGAVCVTAINMIYFVTFLVSIMHVASNHGLGKKFSIILRMLSWILMLQIIAIVLYQIIYFQNALPSQSIIARILGLYEIFTATDRGILFNRKLNWDFLLHPMVLMVSYLIIANASRMILVMKWFFNYGTSINKLNL